MIDERGGEVIVPLKLLARLRGIAAHAQFLRCDDSRCVYTAESLARDLADIDEYDRRNDG